MTSPFTAHCGDSTRCILQHEAWRRPRQSLSCQTMGRWKTKQNNTQRMRRTMQAVMEGHGDRTGSAGRVGGRGAEGQRRKRELERRRTCHCNLFQVQTGQGPFVQEVCICSGFEPGSILCREQVSPPWRATFNRGPGRVLTLDGPREARTWRFCLLCSRTPGLERFHAPHPHPRAAGTFTPAPTPPPRHTQAVLEPPRPGLFVCRLTAAPPP